MSGRTTISLSAKLPHKEFQEDGRIGIDLSLPAILMEKKPRKVKALKDGRQGDNFNHGKENVLAKGGRRKQLRFFNSQLYGNPHAETRPTKSDLGPPIPSVDHHFFHPTHPNLFPRRVSMQSTLPPAPSPGSSYSGTFSHTIKGVKRELRNSGRAEVIIRIMERQVLAWLSTAPELFVPSTTKTIIDATLVTPTSDDNTTSSLDETPAIVLHSRTSTSLIYHIADGYSRFVTHALARYLNLVSMSKPTITLAGELRLTHILKPRADLLHFDRRPSADNDGTSASEDIDIDVTTTDFGGSGYGTNETGETTGEEGDDDDEEDEDRVSIVDEATEDEEDVDVFAESRGVDAGDLDSTQSNSDREFQSTDEDDGVGSDDEEAEDFTGVINEQPIVLSASLPAGSTFFSTSQLAESPRSTPRPRPRHHDDTVTTTPSAITPTRSRLSPTGRAGRSLLASPLAEILSSSASPRPRPTRNSLGASTYTAESEEDSSISRTRNDVHKAASPRSPSVARGERRKKRNGNWELPTKTFVEYLYG